MHASCSSSVAQACCAGAHFLQVPEVDIEPVVQLPNLTDLPAPKQDEIKARARQLACVVLLTFSAGAAVVRRGGLQLTGPVGLHCAGGVLLACTCSKSQCEICWQASC